MFRLFCSICFMKLAVWIVCLIGLTCIRADMNYETTRKCGSTLAKHHMFGQITVDININDLSLVNNPCILFITPKVLTPDETNEVLFYFTDFDVQGDCNRGGLTMYDTYDRNLVLYSRASMCGRNTTLSSKYTIFIVRHGTLVLNYTRNPGKTDDYNHKIYLELKYNSFHSALGDCDSYSRRKCADNDRCIHKDTIPCHKETNINGCGYTSPYTCSNDGDSVWNSKVFTILSVLLVMGVGLFSYKCGPPLMRSACFPGEGRPSVNRERDQSTNIDRQRDADVQETDPTNQEDAETTPCFSRDYVIERADWSDSPTSSIHLSIADESDFPSSTHPSAPPPSYEEFAAPSYEHYMANRDLYQVPEGKP